MAKPLHKVFERRASGGSESLASVAQVMEPETWHICLTASAGEGLAYRVTAHWLTVASDEHPVRPGPVAHMSDEDREDVRWNRNGALAHVGLGRSIESLARFEEFDSVRSDGHNTGVQVDVLRA
jgi:hypothetical protein